MIRTIVFLVAATTAVGAAPSFVPQGPPFAVNEHTAGSQTDPAVALADDGRIFVAWQGPSSTTVGNAVHLRLFDADGSPLGGELEAAVSSIKPLGRTPLATLPDGSAVLAWMSGNPSQVVLQRFSPDAEPQGAQVRVSRNRSVAHFDASVASDGVGQLVVAWSAYDYNAYGATGYDRIYARRLEASGAPIEAPRMLEQVDTFPAIGGFNDASETSVATLDRNGFVVAWSDYRFDDTTAQSRVVIDRRDNEGEALGRERLGGGTALNNFADRPSVSADQQGRFAIAWDGYSGCTDYASTRGGAACVAGYQGARNARRDRDGGTQPTVDPANIVDNRSQGQTTVAVGARGDFLVVWTGGESPDGAGAAAADGDGDGVFARGFDCAGAPGVEFQVNAYTTGNQNQPAVSIGADGAAVVVWTDGGLDGDGSGIFARRFRYTPSCPLCGDADGDNAVRASDALTILRAAVGPASCEPQRCDADNSGDVTATDASAVLRYAVGLRVEVACPLPDTDSGVESDA